MKYVKKIIEYLILSIATIAIAVSVGLNVTKKQASIDEETVSKVYSTFNYTIMGPSDEQIIEFENDEFVDTVFPFYNVKEVAKCRRKERISLLLSENLENSNITFFNDKTLIAGHFDENKLMLDRTASDKLGAKVGDNVIVKIATSQYKIPVGGIYYKSTYFGFDEGVGLMKMTQEMLSKYRIDPNYSAVFVKANNIEEFGKKLENYHPMGMFITEENFIKNYKEHNLLPPDKTEEEWEEQIRGYYLELLNEYLLNDHSNSVQDKESVYLSITNKSNKDTKALSSLVIVNLIVPTLLFSLVSIAYCFINKNGDVYEAKSGTSCASLLLVNVGISLLFSIITFFSVFIAMKFVCINFALYPFTYSVIANKTIYPLIAAIIISVISNIIVTCRIYR